MHRALVSLALLLAFGCGGAVASSAAAPIAGNADADADGLADAADACPAEPEDEDGVADADGCPDPDDDGDGVPDASDLCSSQPEDVDRFEDEDGCPEPDNDRDRVNDDVDQCPCVPEVYNGYQDDDGCPDSGSVPLLDERLAILDKVFFPRRSAVIHARSVAIVEVVAATLAHNPDITLVEVSGHASRDEPGAAALSEARATAVRDALVRAGVDPGRLVVRAHGDALPLVEGSRPRALEQNRRVEFVILEPARRPHTDPSPDWPGPVPGCPSAS